MRSISENAPKDKTIQIVYAHFLCIEVIVQQLTQSFVWMKNNIGSDGTLS